MVNIEMRPVHNEEDWFSERVVVKTPLGDVIIETIHNPVNGTRVYITTIASYTRTFSDNGTRLLVDGNGRIPGKPTDPDRAVKFKAWVLTQIK